MSADPKQENEIRSTITPSWRVYGKHSEVMNTTSVPLSLKTKVHNQCVLSVMSYWAEIWGLAENIERKLPHAHPVGERRRIAVALTQGRGAACIRWEDIVGSN